MDTVIDDYIKSMLDENDYKSLSEFCKMVFDVALDNPNEFTYYSKFIDISELNMPETIVIPLTENIIKYLYLDKFDDLITKEISKYALEYLKEKNFNTNRDLFLKDGKCSFKFDFNKPYIPKGEIENIGSHIVDVCYHDMCMHDFASPFIVLKEFINTNYERPTIYKGMKLNTEFRVFYDFDNYNLMDIINYWDYDTMINNLKVFSDLTDYNTFVKVGKIIENDFNKLKPELEVLINNVFSKIDLTGKWSADFLWDGEKFRIIDMALAEQSYYYDKVLKK